MRIALFSLLLFRDAVEEELLFRDGTQVGGCGDKARLAADFAMPRPPFMAKTIAL